MASSEGDQLLKGAFHAILDKIEADILQIAKSGMGYESSHISDTFFRKIPDINASFAPNDVNV